MKGLKVGLDVFKFVIIAAGVIASFMVASNWDSSMESAGWLYVVNNVPSVSGPLGFGLGITWFLLVIGIAVAVVFGIIALSQNIKKNMRVLVGVGLVVVLALIAYYGIADTSLPSGLAPDEIPTDSENLMISAGIVMFYMLAGITILSMLFLEVKKLFN